MSRLKKKISPNLCTNCEHTFYTLYDEMQDKCGQCNETEQTVLKRVYLIDNHMCLRCERVPTRNTAKSCSECSEGFEQNDLDSHEKG